MVNFFIVLLFRLRLIISYELMNYELFAMRRKTMDHWCGDWLLALSVALKTAFCKYKRLPLLRLQLIVSLLNCFVMHCIIMV